MDEPKIDWNHPMNNDDHYQRMLKERDEQSFRQEYESLFTSQDRARNSVSASPNTTASKLEYQQYEILELRRTIQDLEHDKNARLREDFTELNLRIENPTLEDAWKQYQTVLKLVS